MRSFIRYIKKVCFMGNDECNQGGSIPSEDMIINGVVNNGVLISHMGVVIVHNGG